MPGAIEKIVKGWIFKRKKSSNNPFIIIVRFSILVKIPETKEHKIEGEINVPETQVAKLIIESV